MTGKNFTLIALLICSSLFLFACGAGVNLSDYNQSELDSKVANHEIPDYVLNRKKPKVVVLPLGVAEGVAKNCGVDKVAQEAFIDVFVKVGTVDVLERRHVEAIMKEVKFSVDIGGDVDLSKLSDLGSGIDYVLVGSISGKIRASYTPRKCNEVGEVKVASRILKFPSGIILKSIKLEGEKTISREAKDSQECRIQDPCVLLSEATNKAVEDAFEDLKSLFPLYGYVYKTLTHRGNKKRIAFITIGTEDGIKAGDKVDIVEFVQEKDPVKNTIIYRERIVAECTVLDVELGPDKSICSIQDEKARAVLPKHAVKTKVNVSIGRTIEDTRKKEKGKR